MYRKEYIPAKLVDNDFRLPDICGQWKSPWGSPTIKIFRKGKRYRITYAYCSQAIITTAIFRFGETTFFNLYGWIAIYYDPQQDVLTLSTEGDYTRVEDEN
jgi:hypothetical protein